MNWHILAVSAETSIFNLVELCELTNYFCAAELTLGELALHRIFAKKKAHFGRIRPARNGLFSWSSLDPSSSSLGARQPPKPKRESVRTCGAGGICYASKSRSFLLHVTSYRFRGPGSTCAGGRPRNNKKLCEALRTKHPGTGIVEDF